MLPFLLSSGYCLTFEGKKKYYDNSVPSLTVLCELET